MTNRLSAIVTSTTQIEKGRDNIFNDTVKG